MKRLLSVAGLVLTLSLNGGGTVARAQVWSYYTAEMRLFGSVFCPSGWVLADGTLRPIRGNEALFSLIGNKFGGDGTTMFALPNLAGAAPPSMSWCVAVTGLFPSRN